VARNIRELLGMDLGSLTDTNHNLASLCVASIDHIMDHAKTVGTPIEKVKIAGARKQDNRFLIGVYYG